MAYIGKTPTIGNFQVCDAISVVNGQAAYTMQVGGVNVSPESSQHMLVSLNGVIQKNGGTNPSFTVSGSTITFASNLVTGDVIDFIQILGNVLDLGVPSDSTVSLAKLTATGTKDATTFLRGDNTFDTPPLGGITEADQWRLSASYSYTGSQAYATLTANWERVDTNGFGLLGTGMTESSGVFTFPSTGIYLVTFTAHAETATNNARFVGGSIFTTTDGSTFAESMQISGNALASTLGSGTRTTVTGQFQFDVTNVTTHKVRFEVTSNQNTTTYLGNTSSTYTGAGFIRLGDT